MHISLCIETHEIECEPPFACLQLSNLSFCFNLAPAENWVTVNSACSRDPAGGAGTSRAEAEVALGLESISGPSIFLCIPFLFSLSTYPVSLKLFYQKRGKNAPKKLSKKKKILCSFGFVLSSAGNTVSFYTAEQKWLITSQLYKLRSAKREDEDKMFIERNVF